MMEVKKRGDQRLSQSLLPAAALLCAAAFQKPVERIRQAVARIVGLKTIALRVDNPQVLTRLRDLGVDYAQGFLIHRPAHLDFR